MKESKHALVPACVVLLWGLALLASCDPAFDASVKVTTTAVTSITDSTAVSGGEITASQTSKIVARGVCWTMIGTPTINDTKTSDGAGTGQFVSKLAKLNSRTPYAVRAFATDSNSKTYYGATVGFVTK